LLGALRSTEKEKEMAVIIDHSFTLWSLAWDARNRAVEFAAKRPGDFASDATVAIILAAAATEGFINELAETVRIEQERPKLYSVWPPLIFFADAHDELENSKEKDKRRGSTGEKYLAAAEKLSGSAFKKGDQPYQDFATLMRLRDLHMHLRPQDRDGPIAHGPGEEPTITIIRPEGRIAFIKSLMAKGLTWKCDDDTEVGASWLNLLQTASMADWACRAALNMIRAILGMIPDGPADTARMFKQDFRRRTDDWISASPALGGKK
jgi:hypothetical protein